MNLFSQISSWFRSIAALTTARPRRTPSIEFAANNNIGTLSDSDVIKCQPVMSSIRLLADAVSEITFQCDKPGIERRLNGKPNSFQNRSEFLKSITLDLLFFGEAFIERRGTGSLVTLIPHSPPYVTATSRDRQPAYRIPNDDNRLIESRQMLRLRDLATSSIDAIRRTDTIARLILIYNQMNQYLQITTASAIASPFVLRTPNQLDDKSRKHLSEDYCQHTLARQGRLVIDGQTIQADQLGPIILDAGLTLEALQGLDPTTAQLTETRNNIKNEIAATFGIPAGMIGSGQGEKYNNSAINREALYTNSISPLVTTITDGLSNFLNCEVTADDSRLQLGSLSSTIDTTVRAASSGVFTINEIRTRFLNLDEIDGGDELMQSGSANNINSESDQQTNPAEVPDSNGGSNQGLTLLP